MIYQATKYLQPELEKADACFLSEQYEEALQHYVSVLNSMYQQEIEGFCIELKLNQIKEKIQYCKWYIRDKAEVNMHLGCVLYHIQRFDIEMINDLLDDNLTYQNLSKSEFVKRLTDAFNFFKILGDTYLNREEGQCNSVLCNYKKNGFSFTGDKSTFYINLVFEIESGKIKDIYECTDFKCGNRLFEKYKRVSIDDLPF